MRPAVGGGWGRDPVCICCPATGGDTPNACCLCGQWTNPPHGAWQCAARRAFHGELLARLAAFYQGKNPEPMTAPNLGGLKPRAAQEQGGQPQTFSDPSHASGDNPFASLS